MKEALKEFSIQLILIGLIVLIFVGLYAYWG